MQIKIKMEIEIFFSRSTQEHNPSNGGCLSAVRAAMYYLARSHLCAVGCFINYTLQKKKMQYQYAPLTGVYKPDMKEFFS